MSLMLVTISMASTATEVEHKVDTVLQSYANFPKPGVQFYDVGSILAEPVVFKAVIDELVNRYNSQKIDAILAIDSRGFLFGAPLGYQLGIPVMMLRKPGKLPGVTLKSEYQKEYGKDTLEMQANILRPGQKVIIIDDLLATGGTFKAALHLARLAEIQVVELIAIVELKEFMASRNLGAEVYSIIKK